MKSRNRQDFFEIVRKVFLLSSCKRCTLDFGLWLKKVKSNKTVTVSLKWSQFDLAKP